MRLPAPFPSLSYVSTVAQLWFLFIRLQHYFYTSVKALPDLRPLKRTLLNPIIMAGIQESAGVGRDWAPHGPTAVTILGSESW